MCELKGFITNLGKYNEGYLIGKWVDFPINDEELEKVKVEIGINEEYEEWFYTDYECDVKGVYESLGEYESIDYLNELGEKLESLDDGEELEALEAFMDNGDDFNEAYEHVKNCDYYYYSGCEDMSDVAYRWLVETGELDRIPEYLQGYFDFKAYGRDMSYERNFIAVDGGYIELLR